MARLPLLRLHHFTAFLAVLLFIDAIKINKLILD